MDNVEKTYREKVQHLRGILIEDLIQFSNKNPGIPAQILMAGLGELLIQYSVDQVGVPKTQTFLDHLKEAVERFGAEIDGRQNSI
ncbi:hypothetical protein [Bordetella sp. 02P26C-1]|uniref:hypothetical protein n=1 Tax=Bordetella sp. 02P26C-1 TaxID=2683195 RepID=UPI001353DD43|nr:hypothetical protein [Bordetella sp. 02P26C-1]MVW78078.1 hypothetical protein [Bordetella sp. 02P26C-1]